jgi:hypothetical protein
MNSCVLRISFVLVRVVLVMLISTHDIRSRLKSIIMKRRKKATIDIRKSMLSRSADMTKRTKEEYFRHDY